MCDYHVMNLNGMDDFAVGEKQWKISLPWENPALAEHQKILWLCSALAADCQLRYKCWRRNSIIDKEIVCKITTKGLHKKELSVWFIPLRSQRNNEKIA